MNTATARSNRLILAVLAPFFLLTVLLGLASVGVHHDDDLAHFLMARWARWFPSYLLHLWGRPGLTVPLAGVAWFENVNLAWHAARALSAIVTAISALIAARLAVRMKLPHAHLAVLFCYAQPLVVVLATTTLTENFAALYLVAAVALYTSGRPIAASLLMSLVLVTRHEAVVLLPIWWIAVAGLQTTRLRKCIALLACIAAPVLHNVLFFAVFDRWPAGVFLRPQGSTEHPAAGLLGYVPDALYALPPMIAALALLGGIELVRRGRPLIPALAGAFVLTHIAVKGFGLFASGGYGRFMVTVAPLAAILALAGWNELHARLTEPNRSGRLWLAFAGVWLIGWGSIEQQQLAGRFELDASTMWSIRTATAALVLLCFWLMPRDRSIWSLRAGLSVLGLTCLAQWCVTVGPLREDEQARTIRGVARWIRSSELDHEPIFAANPWFAHELELVEDPRAHKGPALLASLPVGTLFFWDSIYSGNDFHRLRREDYENDPAYELLRIFRSQGPQQMEVWAFRKVGPTPMPESPDAPYPPNLAAEHQPVRGVYYLQPKADSVDSQRQRARR